MKRGTTLLEVLIVIPLLALLFGMILSFVVPALRAWTRSDTRSQAQQSALVVMSRLVRELQYSLPDSVAVFPATGQATDGQQVPEDAVSFLSDLGADGRVQLDPSGSPLWQKRLTFYYRTQAVCLHEEPIDPATDPQPDKALVLTSDPRDRVLARNILSLSIQGNSLPLTLAVQARIESYTSRLETVAGSLLETVNPSPTP